MMPSGDRQEKISQAQAFFPRGLAQPEEGFRFSLDALLLAAFAAPDARQGWALDLGTGCGVAGLALALTCSDLRIVGLDVSGKMAAYARRNAFLLGLEERFFALQGDVRRPGGLRPESMRLVLCNPPYRDPISGRQCAEEKKNPARFERQGGLENFTRAAAFFARNRAICVFIHLAERLDALLAALSRNRLQPKTLLFIHPKVEIPAKLVLVRAIKNGNPGLRVLPPLIMHEGRGNQTHLSGQALRFCPWAACNAGTAKRPAIPAEFGY